MLRIALRNVGAARMRSVATAAAVAVGVALLGGTLVLADTVRSALDGGFAAGHANVDLHVRAERSAAGWTGGERRRIDSALADLVSGVDGVAAAEGRVEGYAQVLDRRGRPVGDPADAVGTGWSRLPGNPVRLVSGREPRAPDEIVLDVGTARAADHELGDVVTVATKGGPVELRLVGVSTGGATHGGRPAGVRFAAATAERLLAEPGLVDAVVVAGRPGLPAGQLRDRVAGAIGTGHEVVTSDELVAEHGAVSAGVARAIRTLLVAFAAVALLVGGLIVHNTFSVLVAQRTREVALLRALGASRRQVLACVVYEAAVAGLVGAAAGALAGWAAAGALQHLVAGLGFDIPAATVVVRPSSLLIPAAVGCAVALVSAALPGRRAASIAPVAALREAATGTTRGSGARIAAGAALLAAGGATTAGAVVAGHAPSVTAVGTLAAYLGLLALLPWLASPAVRFLADRAGAVGGFPLRLARENAARNGRRTASAASSLMIGTGLVTLIAVFAASAKATHARPHGDRPTRPDFVVQPSTSDMAAFSPALAERIAQLPEVERVAAVRAANVLVGEGGLLPVHGVDPASWTAMLGDDTVQGDTEQLGDDEVSVLDATASRHGWAIGTVLSVRSVDGERAFRVAAVRSAGPPLVVSLGGYESLVREQLDMTVLVRKAAGVPAADAERAIAGVVAGFPTATLLDADGRSAGQVESIEQFANSVYVLLGLVLLVSLLGIGTTLALSVVERTGEIGLLRAVGMSTAQVRAMVRWESLLVVLLGCGLGVASGLLAGWALLQGLPDEAAFRVPVEQLVAITGLAAAAVFVASAGPSRRAGRLPVLTAVAAP